MCFVELFIIMTATFCMHTYVRTYVRHYILALSQQYQFEEVTY